MTDYWRLGRESGNTGEYMEAWFYINKPKMPRSLAQFFLFLFSTAQNAGSFLQKSPQPALIFTHALV